MMKKLRNLLFLASVFILFVPLSISRVTAQSFEKVPIADTIEQLSRMMESSFDLDANVKDVWLDYVEILTTAEFQDYTKENAMETGSTYDEVKAFYTPDAEEERIDIGDNEYEYVYNYETTDVDDLSIHLYFYNERLYATAIISNQVNVSNRQLVDLDTVDEVIAAGWPTMDVLEDADPVIFGMINMIKDDQLGSIIAYPSGDSLDQAMLEFMTYEANMPTRSVYFTPENYVAINDGTLQPIADQLSYYATSYFIPHKSLRELVNLNTASNIGYRIASEELAYLLDSFTVRGLVDNVPGDTQEYVLEYFDTDGEMVELTDLEDPVTGVAYTYKDPNNANNLGILTIYFFDNQLAFASIENVVSGWRSASITYDSAKGVAESDIRVGDTLTYLTQMPIEVPAIGVMVRDNLPHQVAVIPVKDSENEVLFVDISNYTIEQVNTFEITEDTGELSDDLFNYIFDQY